MDTQTLGHGQMKAPYKSRYDNFIGGKWTAPKAGRYFDNISPVNNKNTSFLYVVLFLFISATLFFTNISFFETISNNASKIFYL